jgi:hypothetical protein
MSLHPLGVAGFAVAADNPYFVMAGFAAITYYFCCRSRLLLRDNRHCRCPGLRHLISSLAIITLPPISSSSLARINFAADKFIFDSATDGFAAIADHFIADNFIASMAEYFIVAGYNFESTMNNTAIHAKIQSDMLQSISQIMLCKSADFRHTKLPSLSTLWPLRETLQPAMTLSYCRRHVLSATVSFGIALDYFDYGLLIIHGGWSNAG